MTLEQKLTEEDKASILNEVERERRRVLVMRMYEEGMRSDDFDVRLGTASILGALASISPDKFVELYEEGLNDDNEDVRKRTARTLGTLASSDTEKFVELWKKGINDKDGNVRYMNTGPLAALAFTNLDKFLELYQKGINDKNEKIRKETAKSLSALASTISQKTLIPIKDEEYNFLVAYISSKYTQNPDGTSRAKESIQQELINLLINSDGIDYKKLKDILNAGQAKDLDEMVECCRLNKTEIVVLSRISSGGFKQVYKAVLNEKGFSPEQIALKIYDPSKINNKRTVISKLLETIGIDELRRREARLSRLLRHDNLAGTLDTGSLDDGRFYIAEELVEGYDLEQFVGRVVHDYKKYGPWNYESYNEICRGLSKLGFDTLGLIRVPGGLLGDPMFIKPTQVIVVERYLSFFDSNGLVMSLIDFVLIYEQVIQGLRYLHKKGFIHRDLKNDNVIVSNDLETVKITDLQTVIHISELCEKTKGIHGSYNYAAPELLLGKNPSFASDIYSLGVMMYYSLTGELPFGQINSADDILGYTKDMKLYQSKLDSATSKILNRYEKIISKCLQFDPEKRIGIEELGKTFQELKRRTEDYFGVDKVPD